MVVSERASSDPLINQTIEGYEFVRRLGEGTYGMVYLARHPRIRERLVAIKYIKLGNPKEVEKVEQEIEILARLQHPNIVDVYDAYRFDHYQLIVMQLIRGGSLEQSLKQLNGLLDLYAVVEGIEQLAFALGYVHDQSILHLDLKPANILLDPIADGQFARFVLTDFGISHIVNPDASMSANVLGTPMYMSPEHFGFGDNKPDRRSDVYSLGVILYELVVGNIPFQAQQLLDLLNQHAYNPVPLASASIPNLPPALDNIILKAMAKAPEDRFQSAHEMGQALRELRMGPLMNVREGFGARVSGHALGEIAQAGARAMEAIDAQNPHRETGNPINLVIMNPDGGHELVSFKQESIVMGRDKAADLHLDQTTVSRRHAQVDFDRKGHLFITDLQSANGTYLDGVRLNAQERVQWSPNQFVQVQGFLLQIAGADLTGSVSRLAMTTHQIKELLERLQNERRKPNVVMTLAPAIVYVELGKPQYIQVRVMTENTPTAFYELRAKTDPGIDEHWYTLPAGQTIHSGGAHTFDFIVSMPQIGTVGGKTHEIALQVVSDNPDIPTTIQILKVRVVPYTRFSVALRPSEVSHTRRRRAALAITNTGNQSENFSIEVESPDTLKVTPAPRVIVVGPGSEQQIRLKFQPARDASRMRTRLVYTVIVQAASGMIERASGSYIFERRKRISLRLMLLWALLVFVITRALVFHAGLPQQLHEVRALIEYAALQLRGG